jgi:D-alanyl-D-alanine carboxypeptidase (penicillin-binding protein 5/6)
VALGVLGLAFTSSFVATITAWIPTSEPEIEAVVVSERLPATTVGPVVDHFADATIRGTAAFVWDVTTQRSLFDKNADETKALASLTKLMTTVVAFEVLATGTTIAIPEAAIQEAGDSGLMSGERFTIAALSDLVMLSSSNDGARAIAIAGGEALDLDEDPTRTFVRAMNVRAAELGLRQTTFNNPTGLDVSPTVAGGYGSAREVALLFEYILLNHPGLLEETRYEDVLIPNQDGSVHTVSNTNQDTFSTPGLLGSKTGFTDLAGGNLAVAFDAGLNRPVIVVVLGSSREGRFRDVADLVERARQQIAETPAR